MKDQTAGIAVKELVGLKSKMYSLLVDDNGEIKKKEWWTEMFFEQ